MRTIGREIFAKFSRRDFNVEDKGRDDTENFKDFKVKII